MSRIFYIHWSEEECFEHVRGLRSAGFSVAFHASTRTNVRIDRLPAALVISLDRLPSHGRAVAEWFWEAKNRRQIPLIFVGGESAKVELMRVRFQDAVFCTRARLISRLRSALTKTIDLENPPILEASGKPKRKKAKSAG